MLRWTCPYLNLIFITKSNKHKLLMSWSFHTKKKLSNVTSFLQDNLPGLKKIIEACKPFINIYFGESFILDLTGFHTLVSVVWVSKLRYWYICYITYQFRFLWNKKEHCRRSSILGFYIQVLEIQIKKGKSFLFTAYTSLIDTEIVDILSGTANSL